MTSPNGYELLPWDSEFFGLRIGRAPSSRLTAAEARDLVGTARRDRVDCLYLLAVSDDPTTNRAAQGAGFRYVDTRMTYTTRNLESSRSRAPDACFVRAAVASDLDALRAFARESHVDSRFYFDGNFPRERCDALYETWIEKSCDGYADAVLVAEASGDVAGYITCDAAGGEGQIGLVGVGPRFRGCGIGSALVDAALDWFGERRVNLVRVVTQARNVGAQRLYQKHGFRTASVEYWFHVWPLLGDDLG